MTINGFINSEGAGNNAYNYYFKALNDGICSSFTDLYKYTYITLAYKETVKII